MQEIMKAIIHNRVLLCVALSKLGMEGDEIDTLNEVIDKNMEKEIEKLKKGDDDENNRFVK